MDQEARLVTVDHAWSGRWSGRSLLRLDAHGVVFAGSADAHDADTLAGAEPPPVPGTVPAPLPDPHVPLGLIDAARRPSAASRGSSPSDGTRRSRTAGSAGPGGTAGPGWPSPAG
ncbi:hypothetical protein [Frigoribacterium sp. RIT-PI-h]|uniref:hypothetical protein n=1 Tax=Frigoribacterium sp. RIT-PI-h TaxID=1690245 RepID=UPI0006B8B747|nr:hypothetical protein [Frigoribacterium sp. RIT-PI-h]